MAAAREDTNAAMPDTCRITIASKDRGPLNAVTGKYDNPPAVVVLYEGPCAFQIRADINSNVVEPVVAEREWSYQTSTLKVPVVGSEKADRPDAVAECLTARYDENLVGRRFGIVAGHHKSTATARRFRVKEVTG